MQRHVPSRRKLTRDPYRGVRGFDPSATPAVHCGNGFDARFEPYQSTRFSRYNAVPLSLGADMRRREFISLLGGAAVGWPLVARAQQAKVYTIGVLALTTPNPEPLLKALRDGLRDAGYVEGRNLRLEIRTADGRPALQSENAADLVRLKVDLIATFFTPTALAAKQATREIPIVMAGAGDPVATGLVASFDRPGGNVTGLSSGGAEVAGKSVELIREFAPSARRIGVFADETDPFAKPYLAQIGQAARSAGMEMETILTRPGQPLEAAFETLTGKRVDGLIVQGSIVRREMLDLAIKHRLPTLTSIRLGPPLGALMSYGSDYFDLARQSAVYVDKILKGAKPADLPVAFPTKFELIINLKTAKAIGLDVPPMLLGRADEVIE
jgi:putative tryptophan/tyrosine transport system substrate-binding protein